MTKTSNGYTVNCNHHSTEYYDTNGKLYKITTKGGLNTLIQYPDSNSMKIIDEISGRYMIVTKNSNGKITTVEDNSGRISRLEYTDNFLTTIIDVNNASIIYTYDNDSKKILTGKDNANIQYFSNTYDSSTGRITAQKDTGIFSLESTIDYQETSVDGQIYTIVTVKDRNGAESIHKYNSSKQLISKTDGNGYETKYEYDGKGNLTKETDTLGKNVIYTYDANNNLISTVNKLGNRTEYEYDIANNLTKVTYPNGGIVTNVYDANNRLVSSTDLRGIVTSYEYNTQNLLVKTVSSGRVTEYEYTNGQISKITDSLGRETLNQYNSAGFLISTTDADDNVTLYTYDSKGTILSVSTSVGGETITSTKLYDANGCLVESVDANGNKTTYTYNGNLKMDSMTLPIGATIQYSYDNEDRLICVTYPDGTTEETEYDAGGRVVKQKDKSGNATYYTYDAVGHIIRIKDANGNITLKEYDAAGNLTRVTGPFEEDSETPCDIIISYEYDCMGNVTKIINALGGETVYAYNNAGDLLSVTDPLENTTTNTYDGFGNLLTVTDPRGNTTTYTYDNVGNLLTIKNALNQVTENTYDNLNRLVATKDPGGHTTTFAYDELGRQISSTDARGNSTHIYYDANGNVVKTTNESSNIDFEAVYDEGNRVVESTDAAGNKTQYRYDYAGNLTKQIDALENSTSYTYNGNGQMVSSVDALGGECYATYDGIGNLTSMTGPNKSEDGTSCSLKEYIYDAAGRVVQENDTGDNYYTYNALGLKTHIRDAAYHETDIVYDANGRIVSFTDNLGTATYTYDANGNILTATDSVGTVRREYDALNRVTKYTDIYGNTVEYEYDCCGNLVKMIYPTDEVAVYTFDANHNMLSSSFEGSTYVTTYEYNAQNQITKERRPDGSVLSKVYNNAGQLSTLTDLDKNGNIIVAEAYTYDDLGRITEELSIKNMSKYVMTYDALGRLTKRTEYDLNNLSVVKSEESFTYDAAGNITNDTSSDGTSNTVIYNANNRITKYNGKRYCTTNVVGNTTFHIMDGNYVGTEYDVRNRLTNVSGDIYSYTYDVENNRINFYAAATNTKYTYDTSDGRNRLVWTIDHEYNVTTYAYGADGLIWSLCNGEYMIYHYDYRGSVVAVTDIDGNITDTIKYDAYGSVAERTGTNKLIFGYNGKYGVLSDVNGLIYMRTRFYNPILKRFMNADIIDGSIANSTTLNVFAYVNGNPISYVDPFGLSAERLQGKYDIYQLGGEEMAPAFEPVFDQSFVYDETVEATKEDYFAWYEWGIYAEAATLVPGLRDAAISYKHYRDKTGTDLWIDYERAYNEDSTIKSSIDAQIAVMQEAVQYFYENGAGTNFEIIGELFPIYNGVTENWQKTIGAHYVYGYGEAVINPKDGTVEMTVKFVTRDMYNFNAGMSDIATGVPDDVNGRFAVLGWAKEFVSFGELVQNVSWTLDGYSSSTQSAGGTKR